jgi:DNA invertase Pin-like site-specific DNA recombinase
MLGVFGGFEREIIRERIIAGLARAKPKYGNLVGDVRTLRQSSRRSIDFV